MRSGRFSSTIATKALDDFNDDPEVDKRRTHIKQHLTGKPFDDVEAYSAPNITVMHTVDNLNPDIIPSPFVYLDETAALSIILNQSSHSKELGKYDYFSRMKWDNVGSFDDKIDTILNWSKRFNKEYKPIPSSDSRVNLKFSEDLKGAMLNSLSDEESFDFKLALDRISNSFPKYSFESLALLFIRIIPELPASKQHAFINSMNDFFPQNILHFHDQVLESICHELVVQKKVQSVTTIFHAYNEFSHSEAELLTVVSKSFCELYLKGLIEIRDVQTARQVLKTILDSKYAPSADTLTDYFKLVSDVCNQANASKDKKEMLFNIFTKSASSVILQEGMMNKQILRTISSFIRLAVLPQFIDYLKLSSGFKSMSYIPDVIIERILESHTYSIQSDQQKVTLLSSIINQLELDASSLADDTKRKIIKLYADAHSPLAVLLWNRSLKEPLSEPEKSDIFGALQGETDNVSGSYDILSKI
ncbi:hypothetical protein PMKS-000522 [Pichia membranifaciens]|uniref:ATPase expression protein 1 n=1 Tax=Pichia membranifaciens TaxID=4926 RepID=A0A1Q2YC35_9ASCO|nr:hypothetical protein PMKS-000522 [Pichia membranifaciens]